MQPNDTQGAVFVVVVAEVGVAGLGEVATTTCEVITSASLIVFCLVYIFYLILLQV